MPASDYVVLRDGNIDIDAGHGQDFTATIPTPPSVFDNARFSPILWFNYEPLTSHRLKFIVVLNHPNLNPDNVDELKLVLEYDVTDDIRLPRSRHEVLPVSLFKPGMVNTFRFHVDEGRFASRTLWYSFTCSHFEAWINSFPAARARQRSRSRTHYQKW